MTFDHIKQESTTWSHYSVVPADTENKVPCCLGVDEAGRGPVLGSMVYACAYCPISHKNQLKSIGFADSKTLNVEERDALFDVVLENSAWLGWAITSLSPQDISKSMLQKFKYNLNEQAHDTTIALIKEVLQRGVNITEVFIDTVGSPEKYQAKLQNIFPAINIKVTKKADSLFPIVSAASICAKVSRDYIIENWQFIERNITVDREFGSGYPSDPNTVRWLNENIEPVFGFPRIIRFSWSTTSNILEKKGVRVDWEKEDETVMDMFKKKGKRNRDVIYKSMGIEHVSF